MLACAFLTVIMTFFIFGMITMLWSYIESPYMREYSEEPLWLTLPFGGVFFVLMGSLGSFCLPYLIASVTASLFISNNSDPE